MLFDAVVLPGGAEAVSRLEADGRTLEFIKDQYRHCKPILALGEGTTLLSACGIDARLPGGGDDPGVIVGKSADATADRFIAAVAATATSLARPTRHGCDRAV